MIGGRYYYTTVAVVPQQFEANIVFSGDAAKLKSAGGYQGFRAGTHTHTAGTGFSGDDYRTPDARNIPYFVRTPAGDVLRWDPAGARLYRKMIDRKSRNSRGSPLEVDIPPSEKWQIRTVCTACVPEVKF